jgi:hypothetical protein
MTQLRVEGEVSTPHDFSFSDLTRLPGQVDDVGQFVPGRDGSGVRLRSLLDRVGPKDSVQYITLESSDGKFSASLPVAAVQDALVAYRLGDEPLPAKKGGPFRFFIPNVEECAVGEVDACANVKFLGRLHLSHEPGRDVRPTSPTSHQTHHEQAGHERLPKE